MRLFPRSLKYRLLLAILAGVAAVEAAAGYFGYRLLERHSWEQFDRFLLDKWRFYKTTIHFPKGVLSYRMGWADWDRISDPADPDYFQFRYADVSVLPKGLPEGYRAMSPSLKGQALPRHDNEASEPVFEKVNLPGGVEGRSVGGIIRYPYQEKDGATKAVPIHLVVARSTKATMETLRQFRVLIWQTSIVALAGLLTASFFIIRRNVRPVGELEVQIETMPLADPGQRFSLNGAPSELQTVVHRLNALMDRVTVAIENERQFTSNAAHELRTPLAGMRSQIELALQRQRSAAEYEDTLFKLKETQHKLEQLTDNLLLLARLESGQREFAAEDILLGKFVRRVWKPYFDVAADRALQVNWKFDEPPLPSRLPTALLEIVLRNLFQNAVDYTPQDGRVCIHGEIVEKRCHLRVSNTSGEVAANQIENFFRPFWRADQSADPNVKSAGIGLALCKRILNTLGGEITARLEEGCLVMDMNFPVEAPAAAPAETVDLAQSTPSA